MMKITVNIKKMDFIGLNLSVMLAPKAIAKTILLIGCMVLIFALLEQGSPDNAKNWLVMLSVSFGAAIAGFIALVAFRIIMIMLISEKKSGVFCEHTYELTERGLSEHTDVNESLLLWHGIKDVKVDKSFIYINIGGYQYHLIPKRCFDSTAQFLAYAEKTKSLWQKSQN